MQRKKTAVCLLLCALLAAALLQRTGQAAASGSGGTLLLLLDISGSMETSDKGYVALSWVQGLCAMCRRLGVDTEVILFHDGAERVEKDPDGVPRLDGVTYGGNTTNHLKALIEANKILSERLPAEPCGIVVLSDGVLDLIGRRTGSTEPPRNENERKSIASFLKMCGDLGKAGRKMIFIGFGEDGGTSEDPYGLDGFGMLREAGKSLNGRFLQADQFPDEDITHCILTMLDFGYRESSIGKIEGSVIRIALDQSCYKYAIWICKTPDSGDSVPVKGDEILVTKDGLSRGSADDCGMYVKDCGSMVFLCMDRPEAGDYALTLPETVGDQYSIYSQGYVDQAALELTLQNGKEQTVQLTGQTGNILEYTLSGTDCTMKLTLEGDPVSIENIGEGSYEIYCATEPELTSCSSSPLHPKRDDLPSLYEDISFPAEEEAEFIVKASLQINDKWITSDLIRVRVVPDRGGASPEITLQVGTAGRIPQSEALESLSDHNGITYTVKEIQEDGSSAACPEDKYQILTNGDGLFAQVVFSQTGRYSIQISNYDNPFGSPQIYNVTGRLPVPILVIVGVAVAVGVAVIVFLVVKFFRKKGTR